MRLIEFDLLKEVIEENVFDPNIECIINLIDNQLTCDVDKNTYDSKWTYITNNDESYPEPLEEVIFIMEDGRKYIGICDCDYRWLIEGNNEECIIIDGNVERWKYYEIN